MSLDALYQNRPRSRFLRWSAAAALLATAASWAVVGSDAAALISPRAQGNLTRFLGELIPHDAPDGWLAWGRARWVADGAQALEATAALSLAAMGLAVLLAAPASILAAGNLTTATPFQEAPRGGWRLVWGAARGVLVLARALPEYVLAFVLLLLLGPGAWPALLALAIHNAGILGRLWSEVLEDADPAAGAALWRIGASRGQLVALAVVPVVLGRLVLFVFTRWETAVRESTVLGMLGFVSLGWFVQDARARMHYDELAFYVLLGALLVLAGDAIGVVVRRLVR